MATARVFIDGAEGTTGLRIRQRLALHNALEVITLPEEQRKDLHARLGAMAQADVTLLCLPDAAAREIVQAAPAGSRIIDASTAHRTQTGWHYGFPELGGRRAAICAADRVSVPGCHATGFLALAAPLVEQGHLAPDTTLYCHSLTGYSGGGKQMIAAYKDSAAPDGYSAPRPYALGMQHKHLPEMQTVAGLHTPPLFCPIVDDYYSGMLVSLPLPASLLPEHLRRQDALAQFYSNYYQGEPLIHVCGPEDGPADGTLPANALTGRDGLEIFVLGSDTQVLLAARFDNLGKGASGAAVQCLNLMLGRPETEGLSI